MAAETVAQAISDIRKQFPNMDGLNNEEETKQFVIERILEDLGWNHRAPEEVKRELKVKLSSDRPDYTLNPNLPTAVFIEAKKSGEPLERHEKQLLTYCIQQVVNLAVLTNGRTWWLYLPNHGWRQGEGQQWSKKRFSEIDITSGGPAAIQKEFERFLTKEKVSSGEAVEAARSEIDERDAIAVARKDMVETWNGFVTKPSDELIKLLTGSIASLKDVKPNKRQGLVKEFFQNHRVQFKVSDVSHSRPKPATNGVGGGQSGKPSFIFRDTEYSVKTWEQMLVKLCELIYVEKQDEFDRIMNVQGINNLYFSRNPDDLDKPKLIGDSGIFAATGRMKALRVEERCRKVLDKFGYSKTLFEVE